MTVRRLAQNGTVALCVAILPLPMRLQAQRSAAREGYVVTQDSVRLLFKIIGAGRETLIEIHGGPGVDLESILEDFVPLARRHVVIFYDQRGTGGSSLPQDTSRLTATLQISDLETVRVHFDLARMTLVAHSYGPLLAATYAIAHPDRVQRRCSSVPFLHGVEPSGRALARASPHGLIRHPGVG